MGNNNRGMWIAFIVIIVLLGLGWWWYSMKNPAMTHTDTMATTTATSTDNGTGSTANTGTGSNTIPHVARSGSTVNAIVASLTDATQFNALYQSTGVAATIGNGSGSKYTIFVPTNGAIGQLPSGTISGMTSAEKKRLIQYHVVSGRAIDVDAETAGSIQSLSGDAINFNYGTNKIPMVNSAIVITEYTGSNGTVYLIDNVLLPPKKSTI